MTWVDGLRMRDSLAEKPATIAAEAAFPLRQVNPPGGRHHEIPAGMLSYLPGSLDTEPFGAAAAPSGGDWSADAPVYIAQGAPSRRTVRARCGSTRAPRLDCPTARARPSETSWS